MTLDEIAAAVRGRVVDGDGRLEVSGMPFIDSRLVEPDGLFFALVGERVDAHEYAAAAVAGGAAAAVVTRPVGVPAVVVGDPVEALGRLARHVLGRLPDITVIGLTGSSGKTTAKDLLAGVLETFGETVATKDSFNNEIGLPLTVLAVTPTTRYLVLEMGAKGRGHISYLTSVAPLGAGVVLNVGIAHLGEFGSQDEIAASKAELVQALPDDGLAVLNADDPRVRAMAAHTAARVVTFGGAETSDVRIDDVRLDDTGRVGLSVTVDGETTALKLGLIGQHHAHNAAAVVALATGLGLPTGAVVTALDGARPRSRWRMDVSTRGDGVTVINDAYNANPDSMRAALEALVDIGQRRGDDARTFAVLGEMLELGGDSITEHDGIGRLAVRLDVSQLVVVGTGARPVFEGAVAEGASEQRSIWVPDAAAATTLLRGALRAGDVVLVKASRDVGLERVALAVLDGAQGSDDETEAPL